MRKPVYVLVSTAAVFGAGSRARARAMSSSALGGGRPEGGAATRRLGAKGCSTLCSVAVPGARGGGAPAPAFETCRAGTASRNRRAAAFCQV